MARCEACGRPPQSELDSGKESLLPREVACQGCYAEIAADKAVLDAKGARIYTDAQAVARARANHGKREQAAFDALMTKRLQNNIAGKHADNATLSLQGTVGEIATAKANAQAMLDALNARKALEGSQ